MSHQGDWLQAATTFCQEVLLSRPVPVPRYTTNPLADSLSGAAPWFDFGVKPMRFSRLYLPFTIALGGALLALAGPPPFAIASDPRDDYQARVEVVRQLPGFVAFWDFVQRDPATGQFVPYQPDDSKHDFRLDAVNYVLDYWGEGRPATYDDFPLLGRGPFGQAVQFRQESEANFRPCLLVPRERLHNTGLDVKGPGQSVSMVVWMIRQGGNHAIAGIWHEGTDLPSRDAPVLRIEPGKRQYALFAGLAANNGAVAAHVSENGAKSFGDRYARNLAVTPELIPTVPANAKPEQSDAAWSAVGFVFDNAADTVTVYLDGQANDYWVENPAEHPFFRWPARAWLQAELRQRPGSQPGADPDFPADQFYSPPEAKPIRREAVSETVVQRVEIVEYPFTRVKETSRLDVEGAAQVEKRELLALRVNPFWFGHDLYSPENPEDGGPFTIGRVIHTSRSLGIQGYIGGVAVFNTALSPEQMKSLAKIGRDPGAGNQAIQLLNFEDLAENE